ncbi:glycoside hydrolase family 6 protein [Streptomyces sp. NPDC001250]|uniref:glycoside hydrolase family 6 protein n=1 Tax=unclassified Streptomyces TaxID=2593676 RepID=UPI0033298C9C
MDAAGTTRRLHGVDRSGGEFMCVQGHGIWDGPVDDTAIKAIARWKANGVRIPLNEECRLGVSGIKPEYGGTHDIDAVKDLVARVEAHGMTPILDLHWSYGQYTGNSAGCSDVHATCQKPMPDRQYSPSFWAWVASTFKDDPAPVFDLFNGPYPDRASPSTADAWNCWREGGTCPGIPYEVAGMQDLVDSIRGAGARNVMMAGGLAYANDLGQWTAYRPADPAGNLVAAYHGYNYNTCATESCWNSTLAPVADQVPLVAGEIGENTCAHGFVDQAMKWFGDRGLSYLGWTRNKHLGLLLRAVPDLRLRRHTHRLRHRAARSPARPELITPRSGEGTRTHDSYQNLAARRGVRDGTSVRQSKWVDWNRYVDEQSFARAFRNELVPVGFNPGIGMLIDTSRNGWGGTARPAGPGPKTSVDTYVDGGRYDRRIHVGNGCNQAGAGLGERPQTNPAPGIDAYVWMKPPGESDGSSTAIPNNEGKGFDRMCDPTYTGNARNNFPMSGALPNAPLSGHWFSAQFQQLMQNAYPPLS